jgi:sodium transport system permease protein
VSWRIVRLVVAKELRETLRDRRTVMMMVIIPIFLYPTLFVIIEQLALFGQRNLKAQAARVAVVQPAQTGDTGLVRFLAADGALRITRRAQVSAGEVTAGTVDAAVVVTPPAGAVDGRPPEADASARVRVMYDASRERSQRAREVVNGRLEAWSDTLLARRLAARGLPQSFAKPLAASDTSVASAERMGGYALGRFLPMILILMTVLGAFYPAIDLAAGEKERGTLETLLTAPVPAREIVAGKFVAVALIGFGAAALNLGSMLLTFQSGLFQIARAAKLDFRLPAGSVLVVLAVMVPLAVLFAALFLGIAVRAQSFKEAQNALTPVYLVSIIPAFLASMPGIDFTWRMALVPVGGVAFLFRALLSGNAPLLPSLLALAATCAYAAAALVFAARSFGREEVLFGSGSGDTVREPFLARLRRRRTGDAADAGRMPEPAEALALVGAVAVLFFYLAPHLAAAFGEKGIPLATVLLIGVPAVAFALSGPYDAGLTLGLARPGGRTLAAALLVALGGIPIGWALGWVQLRFMELPRDLVSQLEKLTTATSTGRMLWLLLIVAVLPGICEELVFRGVLMRSLARRVPAWRAIVLSAAVFGAFHLSFETALRFLPTAWLGLLMGYVAWHSRSTVASMAMHALSNGLAVVLVSTPALSRALLGRGGDAPNWLLVAAGPLVIAAGVALLPRRAEGMMAKPDMDAGVAGHTRSGETR